MIGGAWNKRRSGEFGGLQPASAAVVGSGATVSGIRRDLFCAPGIVSSRRPCARSRFFKNWLPAHVFARTRPAVGSRESRVRLPSSLLTLLLLMRCPVPSHAQQARPVLVETPELHALRLGAGVSCAWTAAAPLQPPRPPDSRRCISTPSDGPVCAYLYRRVVWRQQWAGPPPAGRPVAA